MNPELWLSHGSQVAYIVLHSVCVSAITVCQQDISWC
jgi:hypothetical protein